MDNPAGINTDKQKKGIKKLWFRLKTSMKTKSDVGQPSTTTPTRTLPEAPQENPPAIASMIPSASGIETTPRLEPDSHHDMTPAALESRAGLVPSESVIEPDNAEDFEEMYVSHLRSAPSANIVSRQTPTTVLPTLTDRKESIEDGRFDRARAVFARYNITLSDDEWPQPSKLANERVEKKPRMRVRYTCHECNKTFGRDKTCSQCGHSRCNTCIRYPPRKTPTEKAKKAKKAHVSAQAKAPVDTGACHECKTEFRIGDSACPNCEHDICERCLKETILEPPQTAPITDSRPGPAVVVT